MAQVKKMRQETQRLLTLHAETQFYYVFSYLSFKTDYKTVFMCNLPIFREYYKCVTKLLTNYCARN